MARSGCGSVWLCICGYLAADIWLRLSDCGCLTAYLAANLAADLATDMSVDMVLEINLSIDMSINTSMDIVDTHRN